MSTTSSADQLADLPLGLAEPLQKDRVVVEDDRPSQRLQGAGATAVGPAVRVKLGSPWFLLWE